jgi:hypothetical protein
MLVNQNDGGGSKFAGPESAGGREVVEVLRSFLILGGFDD